MQVIENSQFKAEINEHGAELTHLINKAGNFDYIWNNSLWPKHAPVLFPAIGRSVEDAYRYNNQTFTMPQHGFAGDQDFIVVEKSPEKISLALTDNPITRKMYPFHFKLIVSFTLTHDGLQLAFKVDNLDNKELSFSLGSHPAFNVPINSEGDFTDYQLQFSPTNLNLKQFEIVKVPAPYRNGKIIPLDIADKGKIALNYEIFAAGLVIIENDGISKVKLSSKTSDHSIEISLTDFRYVCLWTKEGANAPFLCIEPFQGLPDIKGQQSDLLSKAANVVLKPQQSKLLQYQIGLK